MDFATPPSACACWAMLKARYAHTPLLLPLVLALGCGESGPQRAEADASAPSLALPPENAGLDYQLGGAYSPPQGVGIVARDRTARVAQGFYNICYVNGFQVQPGEESMWASDLILRNARGEPVIDEDWAEALLDVSSRDKRERIAARVSKWLEGCAQDGFDAVEIDNLDSYTRSQGLLTQDDAVAMMALFSARAHAQGLPIGQKNSTELLPRRAELGTDFAVAEECSTYHECLDYVESYGEHVLMIEYVRADFERACQTLGPTHSIVLRDRNLVTQGQAAYVFDGC